MQEGDGPRKSEMFIKYYKFDLFEFIMKPGMSGRGERRQDRRNMAQS